jgi:Xaa-Pro aminopeptidase
MMRRSSFSLFLIILCVSFSVGQSTSGVPYTKYGIYDIDRIRPEECRQRRSTVMVKMDSNSIAIFRAQEYANRSGDVDYRFRQNSNFLYFTGCNESNSTLILIPNGFVLDNGDLVKEILFLAPTTKEWTGENLETEGAREILGFGSEGTQSVALTNDRLKEILVSLLSNTHILYYTPSLIETLIDPISDIRFISWRESMKNLQEKYPNLDVKGIITIVGEMRAVKSPAEIELLQKAADVTIAAHIEAMKSCEPGMFEYQLQAVVEYCFTQAGAEYTGFPSIIGSGPNTQSYHYDANRRKMQSGELVVMDIGAEYHGYSADITRTIPVNGKFTPAQKEIYELVLRAQQAAIDTIFSGMMKVDIEKAAMKVIAEGLIRLGIAKDSDDVKKYCPHRMSHFIGLDVHDGRSSGNVPGMVVLVPGMVVTVEPGIYIPEGSNCHHKYWNIGIRIEDDVVVTDEGRSVLSAFAPQSVADIETLMKKKGIGNQRVGKE